MQLVRETVEHHSNLIQDEFQVKIAGVSALIREQRERIAVMDRETKKRINEQNRVIMGMIDDDKKFKEKVDNTHEKVEKISGKIDVVEDILYQ